MPSQITNYGVWVCKIIDYEIETAIIDSKSPHVTLKLQDNDSQVKSAAINIKSTDERDSDIIYWVDKSFQHDLTSSLDELELGFHPAASNADGAFNLDFVRTTPSLLDINKGQELPHDVEGPDNDIIDQLQPILEEAKRIQSTIYIFGSNWNDARTPGIHDIHMNQGSLPRYKDGVDTDGALFIKFPDGHYEAVFIAFATQVLPTDDNNGRPMRDGLTLSDIVRNGSWNA